MSTPRKRLRGVAVEHLQAADLAIAYAADMSRQASRKREEAEALLVKVESIDLIKNNPRHVVDVLMVHARLQAQASRLDADARTAMEEARRFITAAQYAHKFEEDDA